MEAVGDPAAWARACTETQAETDRERHRERHRETQAETERDRKRDTERQRGVGAHEGGEEWHRLVGENFAVAKGLYCECSSV